MKTDNNMSRRKFLITGGAGALGIAGLAAIRGQASGSAVPHAQSDHDPHAGHGDAGVVGQVDHGGQVGAGRWALIVLAEARLWAETMFETRYPGYEESAARDRFVIAAAGERGDERIVVLSDPSWPSDRLVKAGIVDPQSKQLLISRFPANAEFFINSVYWLAGREELIAISARLQDIRRIQPMDATRVRTVQAIVLIGLPALPVIAGAAVWLVRRRG